jgi:hypothetical protein
MKKTFLIILFIFNFIFAKSVFAWNDDVTHMDLSRYATEISVLSKDKGDYLKNLGFDKGLEEFLRWDNTETRFKKGPIKEWIAEGARLEDDYRTIFELLNNHSRFNNHFHNISWNKAGLDDYVIIPNPYKPIVHRIIGISSLLWAQNGAYQKMVEKERVYV